MEEKTLTINILKMKKSNKWLIAIVTVLMLLIFIFYVFGGYTSAAYVRANWTDISPRVDGYVNEVFAKNNAFVKRGDPLFKLDPYRYKLNLDQTQANLNVAIAQKTKIQDTIKSSQLKLNALQDDMKLLAIEVERYRWLAKKQAESVEQYQDTLESYEKSKEDYEELQGIILEARDQLIEQEGTIELITAQRDLAKFELECTTVLTPFDGYVTNNYLERGLFLQQGQSVFGIAATQSPWIEANFKEFWVGKIKPGQKVWILADLYPFRLLEGEVESVTNAVNRLPDPGMILPYIKPTIDWVRIGYRFTVMIKILNQPEDMHLRMGSDARVFIFCW